MRAHVIKDGKVVNTIEVGNLSVLPDLVSAENGGKIGQLWNGSVFSDDPSLINIPDLKAKQIKQIDSDADKIYFDTLGNRESEYARAESEANSYINAGYSGDIPTAVQAWATATGQTATWAADNIAATATAWRLAQASIRANRLERKEETRDATTVEELRTALSGWNTFVASIRSSLGI